MRPRSPPAGGVGSQADGRDGGAGPPEDPRRGNGTNGTQIALLPSLNPDQPRRSRRACRPCGPPGLRWRPPPAAGMILLTGLRPRAEPRRSPPAWAPRRGVRGRCALGMGPIGSRDAFGGQGMASASPTPRVGIRDRPPREAQELAGDGPDGAVCLIRTPPDDPTPPEAPAHPLGTAVSARPARPA
jgi:hypothetical protein